MTDYVVQSIKKKWERIEKEISNLKEKKPMSLAGKLKKENQNHLLLKELEQVKKELKNLVRKETISYGL